jgi:hypothetical protein
MDDRDRKTFEHISETLDEVLAVLKKPESKFLKLVEVIGNAVGIIGILAVVDIIRGWILGG